MLFGVGVPAFSLVGLLILRESYGVNGAVWAYGLGAILTILLGVILWHVSMPQLQKASDVFRANDLLQSSIPLFWIASLH
ncbi:hypothetical protein OO006_02800 [Prosthecochloris sp. SCSIO W1101]|uniref:hypothetical protein n=1 Tax=Prosthecochloris sp. SCSIO W1101 TaxID=2992242 RepID=UPI00223D28BE|nr:hypothetical protein [Prosthecochloris sp. SCSIO W1101]UZJ41944.1 hypothetical protein OO006_02800 [Prosthecochloris sp. SCSIO W1101]